MSLAAAADIFAPVQAGMDATERALAGLFANESASVASLCSHLSRFGGKRLRPALVHLSAGLVGRPTGEHALIGTIIEALHMASLLHDDVLDGADTRRQVATLNALHGNEVPILLGDVLYSRAFALSLELSTLDAARELAAASEAICRGEIEQSFLRFRADIDEAQYFGVIRDKTASLYAAACGLGARYAGGSEQEVRTLARFGRDLGMAFQIIDDCLDVVGDERVVGKSLGTDLETGKITLPVLRLARRLSGERAARFQEILLGQVQGSRRELLRAEFDLDGVVSDCQQEANGFIQRCVGTLQTFGDGPERQSLLGICAFVLSRSY